MEVRDSKATAQLGLWGQLKGDRWAVWKPAEFWRTEVQNGVENVEWREEKKGEGK